MVEWLRENVDRFASDEDDDDDVDDAVEWLRVNLELFEDEDCDCEDDADGPSRKNADEPHLRWLQRDGELHTSN